MSGFLDLILGVDRPDADKEAYNDLVYHFMHQMNRGLNEDEAYDSLASKLLGTEKGRVKQYAMPAIGGNIYIRNARNQLNTLLRE